MLFFYPIRGAQAQVPATTVPTLMAMTRWMSWKLTSLWRKTGGIFTESRDLDKQVHALFLHLCMGVVIVVKFTTVTDCCVMYALRASINTSDMFLNTLAVSWNSAPALSREKCQLLASVLW